MGFRLQRRIRIAPGIQLNLSKRGLGVSVGPRGARVSVGPSGKRVSAGIPGTGMRYEVREGWKAGGGARGSCPPSTGARAPLPVLPGALRVGLLGKWLKPPDERAFINGAQRLLRGDRDGALSFFGQALGHNPACGDACLMLGLLLVSRKEEAAAAPYLEYAVRNCADGFPWISLYLGGQAASFELPITENVKAVLALDLRSAFLVLAEIYQREGRREEAAALLGRAWDGGLRDNLVKLSLVELYNDLERDEELIELAQGTVNEDDVTLSILFYLGQALLRRGYLDAAAEALKAALRRRAGRDPELLLEIRYVLAQVYESSGKMAMAKKQYEQILARDYGFRDVQERLRVLA